ncbi:cation efflux family-domain-containing protein [Aspergillus pseudoustus]|uniref:Zinc transporter n=1 Tax=Aspergillus pseudoustus TaxID=1810923 RepID=A0ABR4JDW5_9EURO
MGMVLAIPEAEATPGARHPFPSQSQSRLTPYLRPNNDNNHGGHNHSHPHSHAPEHHDHFEPPAVAHSNEAKSLGIQPESAPKKHNEVVAGLLVSLPWIALSWYYQHYAQWAPPQPNSTESIGNLDRTTSRAAGLTAATLLFYGFGALIRQSQQTGRESGIKMPKPDLALGSAALSQVLAVGLPVYATLKVGGFLVAFAMTLAHGSGLPTLIRGHAAGDSKVKLTHKYLTAGLLLTASLLSFFGMNAQWDGNPLFGYIALLASIFIMRPPFAYASYSSSASGHGLGISITGRPNNSSQTLLNSNVSQDPIVSAISGLLLGFFRVLITGSVSIELSDVVYIVATAGSFATCLTYLEPSAIRSHRKLGVAAAAMSAALFCSPPVGVDIYTVYTTRAFLSAASFFVSRIEDRRGEHDHHHPHSHSVTESSHATKLILRYSEPYPLLYSILKERDSRRIFYFMSLNFGFMLVQLSYGFATGSLGLLSDSIHMFFDCLALVVGLCAAVMSKWPPSTRFPYGYGKVDTLSGFANGIFLMIISVEIIYEAVERLSSGSQMHRLGELLMVSVAGLLVNLVGIMAFDHGHAHGHDHGHGHSHGNENMHGIFLHILADTLGSVAVVISTILVHYSGWSGYDPIASCMIAILIFASAVPLVSSTAKSLLLTLPADVEYNVRETLSGVRTLRGVVGYTVPKFWLDDTESKSSNHGHHHGHSHSHDHNHNHNHSHSHTHSHSHDHEHDHDHDHKHEHAHTHTHNHDHDDDHNTHHTHTHGHSHDHDHAHEKHNPPVLGVIHVTASRAADLEDIRQRTVDYLREKGLDILVQVEREGDARCWCSGGANKGS